MAFVGAIVGGVASGVVGSLLSNSAGGGGSSAANDAQARLADTQGKISQDQWDYYKSAYQPVESKVISDASTLDDPGHIAAAEGKASADTASAFDTARKTQAARNQGYGINPASPAAESDSSTLDASEAASKGAAVTGAAINQEQMGRAARYNVAALGRNLPATAISGTGAAAGNFGALSERLYGQNSGNINYAGRASAPFVNAASQWFGSKAQGWFGGGTTPAGSQPPNTYTNNSSGSDVTNLIAPNLGSGGGGGDTVYGFADGGVIASGHGVRMPDGQIIGPGTGTSDSVPAATPDGQNIKLSNGERVIPADVVHAKGGEFFDKLIEKYHKPVQRGFGVGR